MTQKRQAAQEKDGPQAVLEEETGNAEEVNQEFGTSSSEQGASKIPVAGANWNPLRASEPNDAHWVKRDSKLQRQVLRGP